MMYCKSCGRYIDSPKTFNDPDNNSFTEECPYCSWDELEDCTVECYMCGNKVPESKAYGFGPKRLCRDCLIENSDIDTLAAGIGNSEVELPGIVTELLSEGEIRDILMQHIKEAHKLKPFDLSGIYRCYGNDIAEYITEND